jgi:SAM-dependent methyltransferase
MNTWLLRKTYFPEHQENRMSHEGDVSQARAQFFNHRFPNLDFLLASRFNWMNRVIQDHGYKTCVEVGCGAGFSELYIEHPLIRTDAVSHEWVDKVIDATSMQLEDESVDCIIAQHTMHHFYSPYKFMEQCARVLKPGGAILIQEIYTSLLMRTLLRLLRHEGYSYEVNLLDPKCIANDPKDLWSANCAIPELLFKDPNAFHDTFKDLTIEKVNFNECLTFPLSGGVISKVRVPRLSRPILQLIAKIDQVICRLSPHLFALGCSVIIKKKS